MQNELINELSQNFIDYAVACNSDRAIPDATCGLKPVALRILWGSLEGGRTSNKPFVKSARIVGDVMGAYHPHGDSSIYGALVRLSQPWIMRYPLMDFHGNQGNIGGDEPAAMRYTETKLLKFTEEGMLKGIKKNNVPMIDNYDNTELEPVTLPTIFPNLLCNPNTGIGVAIACNWLPHNLKEVTKAIVDYMDGKEPIIPAPDFPTGGLIINAKEVPDMIKNGRGSVKVRGQYKIEKNNIVFYEIPYGTETEALMEEVGKACEAGEIEGIVDIRDESNKEGLRIVLECSKKYSPEAIVNKLFIKTNFQTSISYNQIALVGKTPTELGLVDCIKIYIQHNKECLVREVNFDLTKAKDRLHIVEGLLICLEDIDNVIQLIKKSANSTEAKEKLIKKYKLSEVQAKSVLSMRLSSLAHMEKIELENEKKELIDSITDMTDIITREERQLDIVKTRLIEFTNKYGDDRRTELTNIEITKEDKETAAVVPEDVVVVVNRNGMAKRIPKVSFKTQKRNGKGVKSEDNAILSTISTNTIDSLLIFTDKGKMYRMLVDNLPVGTNVSAGASLNTLVKMDSDEKVAAVASLQKKSTPEFIVFITKNGMIKKTLLSEYKSIKRTTGTIAIKLKDNDTIVNVLFMNEEDLILFSKKGMTIRFTTSDINPIGRATSGVKSMKLSDGDEIICGIPITDNNKYIAVFTKSGLGKKSKIDEYPCQGRVGKGVFTYKDEEVVGAALIDDNDTLLLAGRPTTLCIPSTDVPLVGRVSLGNKMIKDSSLVTVVKL